VICAEGPLGHDFLQLPEAEQIPQVPTDALDDDLGFEVRPLNFRWSVPSHAGQSLSDWPEGFATHPFGLYTGSPIYPNQR
jgi:hypothetical protein